MARAEAGVHESGDRACRGCDFGSRQWRGEGDVDSLGLGQDETTVCLALVVCPPAELVEEAAVPAQRGRLAAAPDECVRRRQPLGRVFVTRIIGQGAHHVAKLNCASAGNGVPHQPRPRRLPGIPQRRHNRVRRAAELRPEKRGYAAERIFHQGPVPQRRGMQRGGHQAMSIIGERQRLHAGAGRGADRRAQEEDRMAPAAPRVHDQPRPDAHRQRGHQVNPVSMIEVEEQRIAVRFAVHRDPGAVCGIVQGQLGGVGRRAGGAEVLARQRSAGQAREEAARQLLDTRRGILEPRERRVERIWPALMPSPRIGTRGGAEARGGGADRRRRVRKQRGAVRARRRCGGRDAK